MMTNENLLPMLGSSVSQETLFICSLVNKGQLPAPINLAGMPWLRLLKLSSTNRVLYVVAKVLLERYQEYIPKKIVSMLEEITIIGEDRLNRLAKTLRYNHRVLSSAGIPYVVAKTDRGLPYVTFDIDVLIPPEHLNSALEAFQKDGAELVPTYIKNETDIIVPELLRIDLHTGFFCHRQPYVATSRYWENTRTMEIQGVSVPVPSIEAELALMIGHTIHERLHVPLLEYFYLRSHIREDIWPIIEQQAQQHGWIRGFRVYKRIVRQIDRILYGQNDSKISGLGRLSLFFHKNLAMPYMFTLPQGFCTLYDRALNPRRTSLYDIGHFLHTNLRAQITKGTRVPIYGHWFDFKQYEDPDTLSP